MCARPCARVKQDERENQRRVAEESRRQELRGKLLTEAEHSARRNATVAMRWADLFSVEVPQELYEEIERQRAQCSKITASKDKLIAEIKNELKVGLGGCCSPLIDTHFEPSSLGVNGIYNVSSNTCDGPRPRRRTTST